MVGLNNPPFILDKGGNVSGSVNVAQTLVSSITAVVLAIGQLLAIYKATSRNSSFIGATQMKLSKTGFQAVMSNDTDLEKALLTGQLKAKASASIEMVQSVNNMNNPTVIMAVADTSSIEKDSYIKIDPQTVNIRVSAAGQDAIILVEVTKEDNIDRGKITLVNNMVDSFKTGIIDLGPDETNIGRRAGEIIIGVGDEESRHSEETFISINEDFVTMTASSDTSAASLIVTKDGIDACIMEVERITIRDEEIKIGKIKISHDGVMFGDAMFIKGDFLMETERKYGVKADNKKAGDGGDKRKLGTCVRIKELSELVKSDKQKKSSMFIIDENEDE